MWLTGREAGALGSLAATAPVNAIAQALTPEGDGHAGTQQGHRQAAFVLQLGATALPHTSRLRVLTPITGPQACRVLTCSEIDVERCVF